MAKSIIVTGASSGIGLATAKLFLKNGWAVGLMARREDRLAEIAEGDSAAVALPCDVTDETAVERAFDTFVQKVGRIDALFNNAGIFTKQAPIDEISLEDWQNVVDVNLTGMFLCARAAFARMRRQDPRGGRIINNGSISAYVPRDGSVTYTTTKHAITGLTKSLSLDGRPLDIACGQIDIGNARTEMVEAMNKRRKAADPNAEPEASMDVNEAAAAVLHMAELPLTTNVLFMTIMATKMAYVGRG